MITWFDMNAFDLCCGITVSLIICLGIFGNTLSFLLWTKGRRCKRLPGGINLRAMAISDNLALLAPAMSLAVNIVSDHDPAAEYNFICKLEIVGRHFGLDNCLFHNGTDSRNLKTYIIRLFLKQEMDMWFDDCHLYREFSVKSSVWSSLRFDRNSVQTKISSRV